VPPSNRDHYSDVAVIGLGYIGLPTAAILASAGCRVWGIEVDADKVNALLNGSFNCPEPGLVTLVQNAITTGTLIPQTVMAPADVFVLAVPTPITADKQADLSFVWEAAAQLKTVLKPGNLVIIESTIPPGTTRQLQAMLPQALVAHCPERVLPGQLLHELVHNHRVVGGTTPAATQQACQLYRRFAQGHIHATTAETAELVKVMENTYRDVNIALANELALIAEQVGVNAREVIELANMHPRVHLHQPGPGVGGHCIAVDPWFLATAFPSQAQLVYTARRRNDSMPAYVATHIQALVNGLSDTPVITLLGLTYKPDVTDTREAPAALIIEQLQQLLPQARLNLFDPVATHPPLPESPQITLCHTLDQATWGSDLLVLLVGHTSFESLLQPDELATHVRHKQVYDTQGKLLPQTWAQAGFRVSTLGVGFAGQPVGV
jgi:UDP-N-acetyl-D-mannosaminuronic acid dehydrogenase